MFWSTIDVSFAPSELWVFWSAIRAGIAAWQAWPLVEKTSSTLALCCSMLSWMTHVGKAWLHRPGIWKTKSWFDITGFAASDRDFFLGCKEGYLSYFPSLAPFWKGSIRIQCMKLWLVGCTLYQFISKDAEAIRKIGSLWRKIWHQTSAIHRLALTPFLKVATVHTSAYQCNLGTHSFTVMWKEFNLLQSYRMQK